MKKLRTTKGQIRLRRDYAGQAIVEVMLAMALAVTVLVGLVHVATRSVSGSGLARRQAQATGLANQALELARSEKDRLGWEVFESTYNGTKCFDGTAITNGSSCEISGTEFTSEMTFTYQNVTPVPAGTAVGQLSVVSVIRWSEGGRTAKATQTQVVSRY